MFRKLLIVGGDSAPRIAHACRELGIAAVVGYSQRDAGADWLESAEETVCLGRARTAGDCRFAPAGLLTAARLTGADAVHPGMDSLAGSALLAEIVIDHGLSWVGADPEVLALRADRAALRRRLHAAGLPIVPGSMRPVRSYKEADDLAEAVGYPVVLRPSAAVVESRSGLEKTYLDCLQIPPGRGRRGVVLEKHLEGARRVEVLLMRDRKGTMSVSDAPLQELPPLLVERLHDLARRAAEAIAAEGLVTVSFGRGPREEVYIHDIEARLLSNHGIDLIQQQIRLASGEPIPTRDVELVH